MNRIFLIPVLLVIVGFLGWVFWQTKNTNTDVPPSTNTKKEITAIETPSQKNEQSQPSGPLETTLVATPASVVSGGSTVVEWSAKNADTCIYSSSSTQLGSVKSPRSFPGSETYKGLTAPLTIEFTCRRADDGLSITKSLVVNISPAKTASAPKTVGPKQTFLAMSKDFTALILGKDINDVQNVVAPLIKSAEFSKFVNKYMTADSVKEYESMPDLNKTMFFMFGFMLVLPDPSVTIKETITGSTATLSYTKSAGTFGDKPATAKCLVKMVLEEGAWKWERSPFTNDNTVCSAQ